jgi:acetoin utilization deacetylase AcuC-like enzyme
MEDPELLNNLMGYLSQEGNLTIEDIRKLSYNSRLYYKSFMEFLKKHYPLHRDLVEAVGNVKSHGYNFTIPQKIIDYGVSCFPTGYIEPNIFPKHDSLHSITAIFNSESYPVETFIGKFTRDLKNYLLEKGAEIKVCNSDCQNLIKTIHPETDFLSLCARRLKREKIIQDIDDVETPLLPEVIRFALSAPSVLFKAEKEKGRLILAIPGISGARAEPEHENSGCYFNNEALFALELSKHGKKVTIIDLDAHFNHALVKFCLGNKNITLIGIHSNSLVDPTINYREDSKSKENSFQYDLEVGANGKEYLNCLKQAILNVPAQQDMVLILGGTNSYLFDSVGLLCVEAPFFKKFGEVIGKELEKKQTRKVIVVPGGGYEDLSPFLFIDFCLGISENLKK